MMPSSTVSFAHAYSIATYSIHLRSLIQTPPYTHVRVRLSLVCTHFCLLVPFGADDWLNPSRFWYLKNDLRFLPKFYYSRTYETRTNCTEEERVEFEVVFEFAVGMTQLGFNTDQVFVGLKTRSRANLQLSQQLT